MEFRWINQPAPAPCRELAVYRTRLRGLLSRMRRNATYVEFLVEYPEHFAER